VSRFLTHTHPHCAEQATRRHPLAVTAFALALLGIPLIGIVTGPIAAILAAIALAQIRVNPFWNGRKLALAALSLGLVDAVVWLGVVGLVVSGGGTTSSEDIFLPLYPDLEALESAPAPIQRALKANVCLSVRHRSRWPFFGADSFIGSGVVIGSKRGESMILTNRHLVDPSYGGDGPPTATDSVSITASFYDGTNKPSKVWWVAGNGIDLALVTTAAGDWSGADMIFSAGENPVIGDRVFAVGNPHEFNWSYTEGVISSIRRQALGPVSLRILQTQAPINTGNSGGGLYSVKGDLLGVVTWTKHKARSEGMSFAISYSDFLTLFQEAFP
jgi:S1-C subfamily serine protease